MFRTSKLLGALLVGLVPLPDGRRRPTVRPRHRLQTERATMSPTWPGRPGPLTLDPRLQESTERAPSNIPNPLRSGGGHVREGRASAGAGRPLGCRPAARAGGARPSPLGAGGFCVQGGVRHGFGCWWALGQRACLLPRGSVVDSPREPDGPAEAGSSLRHARVRHRQVAERHRRQAGQPAPGAPGPWPASATISASTRAFLRDPSGAVAPRRSSGRPGVCPGRRRVLALDAVAPAWRAARRDHRQPGPDALPDPRRTGGRLRRAPAGNAGGRSATSSQQRLPPKWDT